MSAHSTTWSATTADHGGCKDRINFVPYQILTTSALSPLSFLGWVSNPSNGMQYNDFNTMRYVGPTIATNPQSFLLNCFDIQDVMTPNGLNYWSYTISINWPAVAGAGVQFTKWSDFIAAIQTSSQRVNTNVVLEVHGHVIPQIK